MYAFMIEAMERGFLPDAAIRFGIRQLCKDRLQSLEKSSEHDYIQVLKKSPIAVNTREANEQHYELPAEFFSLVLGKNRKYSSAFWPAGCENLDDAEDRALQITMDRAEITDGMKILELGCGWGSLTLAMAKKFPQSKIVALSNSSSQREYIESEARARGLSNIKVVTRNIAEVGDLSTEFGHFDRVVSVEMFEHLRNYEALFEKISSWLTPEGKLFAHIFTHQHYSYFFETEGEDNWMGRYFFTGGQMPSDGLLTNFQKDLSFEKKWLWDGTHYGKTAEAWLALMDQNYEAIYTIFEKTYGAADAQRWVQRWRVFFMSCAELFHYADGSEWGVTHYLFSQKLRN
jgi:cyclopropane-fatty-acyl-phospholipid synthase